MALFAITNEISISEGAFGQSEKSEPDLLAIENGNFVIAWRDSSSANGRGSNILGSIFNSFGIFVDSQFLIGEGQVSGNQVSPRLSGTSQNGYVVAIQNNNEYPTAPFVQDIRFSIFDQNNFAILSQNNLTSFDALEGAIQPAVATLSNGNFAFAWVGGADQDIFTTIIDINGFKISPDILVPSNTGSLQFTPAVTALTNGNYVILWADSSGTLSSSSDSSIKGQLFSSYGLKIGAEFRVNQIDVGAQGLPTVASLPNGGFVASWQESGGANGDSSGSGINAQRFDAAANPVGPQLLVNTFSTDNQSNPDVSVFVGGGFVITWDTNNLAGGDGSGKSIKAQVFDVNGVKVGSEFRVNVSAALDQFDPTVSVLSNGRFAISWESAGAIRARIFSIDLADIDGLTNFSGTSAGETLRGTSLNDGINGLGGDDTILGFAGDDVLLGGDGNDYLIGGIGVDTLDGGLGLNRLQGGVGNDVYIVTVRGDSTTEFANEGIDEVRTTFASYSLQTNVENLTLTDNAAHGAAVGNILNNEITGGTGADSIFAREGNDTLRGGTGAANTLFGQQGDDIYVVEAAGDSIIEFANEGIDIVQTARASFTLRAHVENLVYTGAGTFTGIGAVDGNSITGGANDDFLSGLGGDDILIGRSGADFLLGGAGADQYRYEGGETGFDRITDFVSGIDKIALRDAGFAQTPTIALAQSGAPVATSTDSTFLYNVNNGILSFDADGTGAGAAVVLAQLNAGLTLAAGDFIFY